MLYLKNMLKFSYQSWSLEKCQDFLKLINLFPNHGERNEKKMNNGVKSNWSVLKFFGLA